MNTVKEIGRGKGTPTHSLNLSMAREMDPGVNPLLASWPAALSRTSRRVSGRAFSSLTAMWRAASSTSFSRSKEVAIASSATSLSIPRERNKA